MAGTRLVYGGLAPKSDWYDNMSMGPIRRTINLVLALALTILSASAFVWLIFFAPAFKVWMPISAGVFTFVGLYWIWADFINADPRPED